MRVFERHFEVEAAGSEAGFHLYATLRGWVFGFGILGRVVESVNARAFLGSNEARGFALLIFSRFQVCVG